MAQSREVGTSRAIWYAVTELSAAPVW